MSGALFQIRFSAFRRDLGLATALAAGTLMASPVLAQEAPADTASAANPTGDIIVSARRKDESILKTPISITALTAADIAAKGTATIQDIAQSTPGLNVQNAATTGGRADRSFTSIQLRGFVPSTSAAQTASIFIDGAPVSVATALQALTNPERVEVIKGPQSALFGRQTFAGAVNVVTKAPSDHWTGSASISMGSRANYDGQAEISGPIVKDVLSFRASGRAMGKNGSYQNPGAPGKTLGDQKTYTGSLAIKFTPTDHLTIKGFGLFTELRDGPAATGLITATGIPGKTVAQSNCTVGPAVALSGGVRGSAPWFCGVAPGLSALTPASNVAITPALSTFLNLQNGQRYGTGTVSRVLSPSESVDGYGLVNHFRHYHLSADWDLGDSGFALHSLTAWNTEKKAELADLDNVYSVTPASTAYPEGYYNFPFMIEARSRDFSQELRSTFENGGPIHGSFGGSYLVARQLQDSGSPMTNALTASGATQSRTWGLFGSLGYDITSNFSLSADARYQLDKIYVFAGPTGFTDNVNNATVAPGGLIISKLYKNFLPRVIGQFNWNHGNMIYASYSKGVNPGAFNTTLLSTPEPQIRAQGAALGYGAVVNPEKITNYEVGAKGRLFGGRLRYDAAAFMAIWNDQIQNQSLSFAKVGTDAGPAAAGTLLQLTASANSGRVRIWGLESNNSIKLAKGLDLDLTGAYINSYILQGTNVPVSNFYNGNPNATFRGKEQPYISKWSGSASLAYTTPIKKDLDAFGRVDFTYKSGGWSDVANSVRAPDMNQVNIRLGIRGEHYSIEGWMTNVFNNRAYYNISTQSIISNATPAGTGSYSALIAQLRELRTAGVRLSFNF